MDISISTGLYYTKSYKEILDIISHTECKNIELFLNQAFINVPLNELEKEVCKRNLNVLSIHTPLEFLVFPYNRNEDFWIKKCIDIAQVFNSKTIVSHMVYEDFSVFSPKLDEIHKENILKYRDYNNISITTENLPFYPKGSFLGKFDELLKFVSENNVAITFDTTHCAYGNFSITEKYIELGKYIKNIHLSDYADGNEHKILGQGNLPIREFLTCLKADNYSGIITIELDFDNKTRNDIKSNEQAIEGIEKSLLLVKSVACE